MFNLDDGYGRDLHNYDLFANLPWIVNNPMPTIWLWLANIGFDIGKYAVGFSVWFTEWSLSAHVVDWVKQPAQQLEQIWQTSITGGLKLRQLALLIAMCYLGLLFARGLTTRAWRETLSTIAINVLATAILTHPVEFLVGDGGVLSLSRDLGADVSAVIMGQQPGGTGNPGAPIGQAFIDNLLITSWEVLNYGTPITGVPGTGSCQYSVKRVLDQGPWSSKDDSTPARNLDGCPDDYGKFNEVADGDRALGAWAYAVAMLLFAILTVCLGAIQALAPYFLLFEGLLLTLALIAAVVPSLQHQLTYRISSIAATIAKLLLGLVFLATMTVLVRSLMLADLGPPVVRFAVIDLVVFSGFLFRKRLAAVPGHIRARLNTSLQRAGRPLRAPQALPTPLVAPGPHRLSRTISEGTTAFSENFAPARQLGARLLTAGKTGATVGGKALSYTVGAPIAWPAAASRARTMLTSKSKAAGARLGAQAAAAKTYAATYAHNVGTATGVVPAWRLLTRAATTLTAPGPHTEAGNPAPAATETTQRVVDLTPMSHATTPMVTGANLADDTHTGPAPTVPPARRPLPPNSLPPGMIAPPNPLAQRLRDRLDQYRHRS